MTNIVSDLRDVVRDHPQEVALSVAGNETTYAELWAMTGKFASGLVERGVGPGDVIALYLPNLPQFVVAFHGVLRAGGVVVPMNPQYKAREIRHILQDSAAGAVVTTNDHVEYIEEVHEHTLLQFMVTADGGGQFSTGFAEFLDNDDTVDFWEVADRDDDDVAALPYTSGTTGDPKGVRLTHGNLASNARAAADLVPGGVSTDDAALGALPLFHIYGMTVVMNATLLGGGTFYPVAEWDAGRALQLLDGEALTIFHGVPAMYNDLLHHPDADAYDLSSVRLAGVGGSGIPTEVLRQFEAQFDVTIYEGYGLTETSPVTHFNAPEWGRRVGSIGKALPDVEARVVDEEFRAVSPVEEGPIDDGAGADQQDDAGVDLDEVTGELVVAGPNVMAGYHDLEEANEEAFTEADGRRWFHTGDVAYRDEDGYFYVVDRKTDVVVTGGYNVYPREVEELLFEHEAVADAAVVGVPDERRGETVKAYVVPTPGADVDEDDVRQFCLENLAEYKHPRVVEFVEELPRTTTGKVQKYRLREGASADGAGDDGTPEADPDGDDAGSGGGDAATDDGGDGASGDDVGETGAGDGDVATGGQTDDGARGEGAGEDGAGTLQALVDIDGISDNRAETLREAGFASIEDVREASREDLAEIEGIGDALAERIKDDVGGA